MGYTTDKIRNIALLGHGSTGKTSLAESALFLTGATDRLGRVSDGNTVGDYDAEEIRRQITISAADLFAAAAAVLSSLALASPQWTWPVKVVSPVSMKDIVPPS